MEDFINQSIVMGKGYCLYKHTPVLGIKCTEN